MIVLVLFYIVMLGNFFNDLFNMRIFFWILEGDFIIVEELYSEIKRFVFNF